jgi:hypothetical protein
VGKATACRANGAPLFPLYVVSFSASPALGSSRNPVCNVFALSPYDVEWWRPLLRKTNDFAAQQQLRKKDHCQHQRPDPLDSSFMSVIAMAIIRPWKPSNILEDIARSLTCQRNCRSFLLTRRTSGLNKHIKCPLLPSFSHCQSLPTSARSDNRRTCGRTEIGCWGRRSWFCRRHSPSPQPTYRRHDTSFSAENEWDGL